MLPYVLCRSTRAWVCLKDRVKSCLLHDAMRPVPNMVLELGCLKYMFEMYPVACCHATCALCGARAWLVSQAQVLNVACCMTPHALRPMLCQSHEVGLKYKFKM